MYIKDRLAKEIKAKLEKYPAYVKTGNLISYKGLIYILTRVRDMILRRYYEETPHGY